MRLPGADRHRTASEAEVIDLLVVYGWMPEVRRGARETAVREAAAALERFVGRGLAFAPGEDGARRFDPAEVVDFMKWTGQAGREPIWNTRNVLSTRADVWEAFGGGEGLAPPPETLGPRRYAVSLRRTFNLAGKTPGERVRLRLPLPIADAQVSDVEVDFGGITGAVGQPAIAPARLDVVVAAPAGGEVAVAIRSTFVTRPQVPAPTEARLDPAEAELFTRPKEGLIRISPAVRALSERLAGALTDPWDILRRFWRFLIEEFCVGMIRHGDLDQACPLDWALAHGWYDCQLGSALMAALCRARGMPARLVGGYLLYEKTPAVHSWLEVWIGGWGWVPFDLLAWEASAAGRDEAWRDYWFGQLDHRVAVERPPHLFNGPGGVRLPRHWQLLQAPREPGVTVIIRSEADGALLWRDEIAVERLGVPA